MTFKSVKHFGLSFAFNAPKIWHVLPNDVPSKTSVCLFHEKAQNLPVCKSLDVIPIAPWYDLAMSFDYR